MSLARDIALAAKAKRHGANYSLRIIKEARFAGLPISLAFALVEQESNFSNVFGHDPTIYAGAGKVTKAKYRAYKAKRDSTGKMQGVGPCQLTWWKFQDRADERGGCWVPRHNIAVAFDLLVQLVKSHGRHDGLAIYNAGAAASAQGRAYARSVLSKMDAWHKRLA